MRARSCRTLTKKFVRVERRAERVARLAGSLSHRALRVDGGADRVRRRAQGVERGLTCEYAIRPVASALLATISVAACREAATRNNATVKLVVREIDVPNTDTPLLSLRDPRDPPG